MNIAARRWRVLSAVPIALGIIVIFAGSFAEQYSGNATVLGLPSTPLGGALVGLGVGLFMAARRAANPN